MTNNCYTVKYDIQNLPVGLDTADCNGVINITKPGAEPLAFGAAKCGEGNYRDTQYLNTRAQYDALGLPFIGYFVLRHSGDSIAQQVRNFLSWAGSGCYAYSPDLEKTRDSTTISNSKISSNTREFVERLLDAGKKLLPYSSQGWINEKFRSPSTGLLPSWVTILDWWFARYSFLGETSVFDIPNGIPEANVKVVQTSNVSINQYGSKYQSVFLDKDRWVRGYPGTVTPPSTEDETPTPIPTFTVTSMYDRLTVRSSPEKADNDTGNRVSKGHPMVAYEITTDSKLNTWAHIATGWIAVVYDGTTYSKIS
jgi:hypothetical protein